MQFILSRPIQWLLSISRFFSQTPYSPKHCCSPRWPVSWALSSASSASASPSDCQVLLAPRFHFLVPCFFLPTELLDLKLKFPQVPQTAKTNSPNSPSYSSNLLFTWVNNSSLTQLPQWKLPVLYPSYHHSNSISYPLQTYTYKIIFLRACLLICCCGTPRIAEWNGTTFGSEHTGCGIYKTINILQSVCVGGALQGDASGGAETLV